MILGEMRLPLEVLVGGSTAPPPRGRVDVTTRDCSLSSSSSQSTPKAWQKRDPFLRASSRPSPPKGKSRHFDVGAVALGAAASFFAAGPPDLSPAVDAGADLHFPRGNTIGWSCRSTILVRCHMPSDGCRIGSWEHEETKIDLNMCILKKGKIELLCYDGLSRPCGVSTWGKLGGS